jgi:hypothetical protein
MAIAAWATVVTGTWIVYPWYRSKAPTSPKSQLVANPGTANWHNFGMEWKEHIAWIAPLPATAVAFGVTYYGRDLIKHQRIRKALMVTFGQDTDLGHRVRCFLALPAPCPAEEGDSPGHGVRGDRTARGWGLPAHLSEVLRPVQAGVTEVSSREPGRRGIR